MATYRQQQRKFKPAAGTDPFRSALDSAARLREFATPTMPQIRAKSAPATVVPMRPAFIPGNFAQGGFGGGVGPGAPGTAPGNYGPAREGGVPRFSDPTLSHYENGTAISSQLKGGTSVPGAMGPGFVSTPGGFGGGVSMGTPGDASGGFPARDGGVPRTSELVFSHYDGNGNPVYSQTKGGMASAPGGVGQSVSGGFGGGTSMGSPGFVPGASGTPARDGGVPRTSGPVFSHYDENGNAIYSQTKGGASAPGGMGGVGQSVNGGFGGGMSGGTPGFIPGSYGAPARDGGIARTTEPVFSHYENGVAIYTQPKGSVAGGFGGGVSSGSPAFVPGGYGTTPREGGVARTSEPVLSHYDGNGNPIYSWQSRDRSDDPFVGERPGGLTQYGPGTGIVPPWERNDGTGGDPSGGELPRGTRPPTTGTGVPPPPANNPGDIGTPPGGGAPVVPTPPPPANAKPVDDRLQRYRDYEVPGKGKVYSYLTPEILQQWDAEAARALKEGYTDFHITDWLRIKGYPSPIDNDTVKNMPPWMRNNSVSTRPNDRQTGIPTRFGQSTKPVFLPGVAGPVNPNATNTGGGAGGAGGGTAGAGTGTGTDTTTTTATTPPPFTASETPPQLGNFNDSLQRTIEEVSKRYQPGFARDRDDLQQRLMQTGAVSGALNAGGFSDVVGDELVNLASKQSAQLGEEISKQTINATQLSMQKYVAELQDSFSRLQLKTNADLETKAQELQKYGIDKNDFLERYKADLQLKGQVYSADKQVDAASMQAAAAGAAAAAQAAASRYNADRDYQLGLVNADIQREQGMMQFVLGLSGQNADWLRWFTANDPFSILTGNQTPGDVVVKP